MGRGRATSASAGEVLPRGSISVHIDAVLVLHAVDLGQALIPDHAPHFGALVLDRLFVDALVAVALLDVYQVLLAEVVAHALARVAAGDGHADGDPGHGGAERDRNSQAGDASASAVFVRVD